MGDVHNAGLNVAAEQFLYQPMVDSAGGGVQVMTMTLRTAVEPLSLVSTIRSAIAEVDARSAHGEGAVDGARARRFNEPHQLHHVGAASSPRSIALFLGAVGIYGVLSYVVSLRTPEIGTRLALGASPGAVLRMVLSQGMRLAGAGALLGRVAALALGRVIVALLYGVSPFDPVTLVVTSAIFLGVAGPGQPTARGPRGRHGAGGCAARPLTMARFSWEWAARSRR